MLAESEIQSFVSDPCAFFEMSYTTAHSQSRDRTAELQRAGLAQRFEEMSNLVPMVAKLAARQKISKVEDFEEVVPLLFEHTMYKSYPMALLERRQFDRLTDWLDKLTTVDVSELDMSTCDSIDSWLGVLANQTDLDVCYSSGTTGTMSFIPWSKCDLDFRARAIRVGELQNFGASPTHTELEDPFHYVAAPSRNRHDNLAQVYTRDQPGLMHLRSVRRPDADLLWLSARIRLAAARGDASKVDVPPSLLARRDELQLSQATADEEDRTWLEEIECLQNNRVVWINFPYDLHSIAAPRVAAGERWMFAPESAIVIVGGSKGKSLPPDWFETIRRFLDARIVQGYGMVELSDLNFRCSAQRYHIQPWIIPFVLDPETSKPLPRQGTQTGRFAFFDLAPGSHWGGLMTGDEVELDFESGCSCGATTLHIGPQIARLSDKRGGDDKISCAATPEAYAEAMEFLTSF